MSQSPFPLISVIIPTYNHGEYIVKAVNSFLQQTYPNVEVVVVNDCSPDDTDQVMHREFGEEINSGRILYIKLEHNSGQRAARDIGVRAAHGELVFFADSDDMFLPEHLILHFARLQEGYDCVHSHTSVRIDDQDKVTERRKRGFPGSVNLRLFLFGLVGSNFLISRGDFLNSPGFSLTNLKYGEDWAYLVDLVSKGKKLCLINTATLLHREHVSTLTHNVDWYAYRKQNLYPFIENKLKEKEISSHQYAIFVLGTCFNAPFSKIPYYFAKALLYSPLLLVREPAAIVYLFWNLQRRLGRVWKRLRG